MAVTPLTGFLSWCALCVLVVTSENADSGSPRPSCSVKGEDGVVKRIGICSFSYNPKEGVCEFPEQQERESRRSPPLHDSSFPSFGGRKEGEEEEEEGEEDVKVRKKPLDSANSLVDISFTLRHNKRVVVTVGGRAAGRARCLVVRVRGRPGRFTLHDLPLPHGSYVACLILGSGDGGVVVARRKSFTLLQDKEHHGERVLGRQRRAEDAQLSSKNASAKGSELASPQRPYISTSDLVLIGPLRGGAAPPPASTDHEAGGGSLCCKCFIVDPRFFDDRSMLRISYSLNETCDPHCSEVTVQLYRRKDINNSDDCDSRTIKSVLDLQRIGHNKNVSQGPIDYSNLGSGCYLVELKPHKEPWPDRTSFWVNTTVAVTNMDLWNTTFYLDPNPDRRSLEVRWTQMAAYNFSEYELHLWYHPRVNISCRGDMVDRSITISIIPDHRLVITEDLHYTFNNLSSGYYCARLTPLDDRCRLDGCQPLSSPAKMLKEPRSREDTEGSAGHKWRVAAAVAGSAVGALVSGLLFSCCIVHSRPFFTHLFSAYAPVPVRSVLPRDTRKKQVVLLVWTPYGPHGHNYTPVISAFKNLLRTYCHCEVYDYLDLPSLPEDQQFHLLSAPTAWLDHLLAKRSLKIIIVATEGAKLRQVKSCHLTPPPSPPVKGGEEQEQHPPSPLDNILFPYLLRRLQDHPDLGEDYSRIFQVRFPDVSDRAVELGNIVSHIRYRIPEHLRSLSLSLHGCPEDGSLKEPSQEQLQELQAALASHPHYLDCRTTTHSNGITTHKHKGSATQPGPMLNGGRSAPHTMNGRAECDSQHNGHSG